MRNIVDFGAVADPKIVNTKAIQAALDAGAGRVVVPAGEFLTGTVYLRDDVELHLEKGAVLKASVKSEDWNKPDAFPQNWWSEAEKWDHRHLILGVNIKNASITGEGTIDGSGDYFYGAPQKLPTEAVAWRWGLANTREPEIGRPGQMIEFCESQNIRVSGITMKNSPCWTLYFFGCDKVEVRDVVIRNPITAVNTDGIDVDCCSDVEISGADIDTGDDAIAIRGSSARLSNPAKICERVTVKNCKFGSSSSVVRIGVGKSKIKDIRLENIDISRGATGFHIMGSYGKWGTDISNIHIENVRTANTPWPVSVSGSASIPLGRISNVTVRNLQASDARSVNINREKLELLENINLENVNLIKADYSELADVTYHCTIDNTYQHAMFRAAEGDEPRPLLVALHTWSANYQQDCSPYANVCKERNWHFIFPDFRGPNKTPDGCGSDKVIQDIADAVAFAEKTVKVDKNRIYLLGGSGGGHAALLMAARRPELWTAVSAWCAISDIAAWHAQCAPKQQDSVYARHIEAVVGGDPSKDAKLKEECLKRSPLFWMKGAADCRLEIATGIHDGHTGSVPVSHTVNAYNALAKIEDRIPEEDIRYMEEKEAIPAKYGIAEEDPSYGKFKVLLRRQSNMVRMTLFEGGHNCVARAGIEWLSRQSRDSAPDWSASKKSENNSATRLGR